MINQITASSYFKFPFLALIDRIRLLTRDFQTYTYEGSLADCIHEKTLIVSLKSCLDHCQTHSLTSEETEALKILAQEIKRDGLRRKILWNSLSTKHQSFINALEPLTESPEVKVTNVENPDRFPAFKEANANFGDGKIYWVKNPKKTPDYLQFDLVKQPGLEIQFFRSEAVKQAALRREARQTHLVVLNVPFIKSAIHETYEIKKSAPIVPLSEIVFSTLSDSTVAQMAQDIHTFLLTERIWNINLLGKNPEIGDVFALHDKRVILKELPPIPSVLTENVSVRHKALTDALSTHSKLSETLRALDPQQNEIEQHIVKEIQILKDFNCDAELVATHLEQSLVLRAILKHTVENFGSYNFIREYASLGTTTLDFLKEYALILTKDHLPVDKSWKFEDRGDYQSHHNHRFALCMLYYLLENFQYKNSLEEQIQHVMKYAEDTLTSIGMWLNSQKAKTPDSFKDGEAFFWSRVGDDFVTRLAAIMNGVIEKSTLHDQLILIRFVSEQGKATETLNEELRKCLQQPSFSS